MTFGNGRIEAPEQSLFTRHIHNSYEIYYFSEGDADFIVGSAVYRMNRRDLLVIKPGDYHYLRLRSNAPYRRFIIHFSLQDLCLPAGIEPETGMFHIARDSLIHRFFEVWLESQDVLQPQELETFVRSGASMLLILLQHQLQQILPAEENPVLKQILHYIDTHPEENLKAGDLSSRFFVSTSWIVHIFQRHLGITLMQYIRKKRILYAQSLIHSGEPPTEVAVKCQYENYATFYRQYKAVLGYSPNHEKSLEKNAPEEGAAQQIPAFAEL